MIHTPKVLVTGGAGFIGYHVARELALNDYQVVVMDNVDAYYSPAYKNERIGELCNDFFMKFRYGDVTCNQDLNLIFSQEKFDYVIHLAAQPGPRYPNQTKTYEKNVMGTSKVLDACQRFGVKKVLYASSSSVYGKATGPCREDAVVGLPTSHYGASKVTTEMMARIFSNETQIPTIGMRFFTVYGPWGRPDMAVYQFTDRIAKGLPIQLYGEGTARDFTYVKDVAESVLALLLTKVDTHIVVNIGAGEPVLVEDMVEQIATLVGQPAIIERVALPGTDASLTHCDNDRLYELTGYRPSTRFNDGIVKFVDWYKNKK